MICPACAQPSYRPVDETDDSDDAVCECSECSYEGDAEQGRDY